MLVSFLRNAFIILFLLGLNIAFLGVFYIAVLYHRLPSLDNFTEYRPRQPMQIYSADNQLIGEFGEERRKVLQYGEFPKRLVNALLATEDERFFQHRGVDFYGVGRAALGYIEGRREGASTITMQLARNLYLTNERTIARKLLEMMLAFQIELNFRKEDILALYMNHIYLGHGSYGFAASAREYYGKTLDELTDAEIAVLVGIPKAPSTMNPRSSPLRAKERQRHVLGRMYRTGLLSDEDYQRLAGQSLPLVSQSSRRLPGIADYAAEEIRRRIFDYFGKSAYERGFRIYTTIRNDLQAAAKDALRAGLMEHQWRQDYAGPEQYIDTRGFGRKDYRKAISDIPVVGGLAPAIVVGVKDGVARVYDKAGEVHDISGRGLQRIRRHLGASGDAATVRAGAVVRLRKLPAEKSGEGDSSAGANANAEAKETLAITDLPQAQAALVAMSSDDGAILAMVGGFDFAQNQFNNAIQARRQPGSALKPFLYSAALEKGITPASALPDTPIFLSAEETGNRESWQPKNYDGKTSRSILMRDALAKSKNLATIHLTKYIGTSYARDYMLRFGFRPEEHPAYLTIALGAGATTVMELARAYSAFPNGGYLVEPYLITRIEDFDGNQIVKELDYAKRRQIIDARNAFIMSSILRDVIYAGTGRRAAALGRRDIGGKTGTTNDTRDAWFAGYGSDITAVSWMGYSNNISLGDKETGARAALPIWLKFMRRALADTPEYPAATPPGIIAAEISRETGAILSGESDARARREYFYAEYLPAATAPAAGGVDRQTSGELF